MRKNVLSADVLSDPADVLSHDRKDRRVTRLHKAVAEGNMGELKRLIKEEPWSINYEAEQGDDNSDINTPLTLAVRLRDLDAVRELINEPLCDVNLEVDSDKALSLACIAGYIDIVEVLMTRKDLQLKRDEWKTALMETCEYQQFDTACSLLKHESCDILARYLDGRTALHFCMSNEVENFAAVMNLLKAFFNHIDIDKNLECLDDNQESVLTTLLKSRGDMSHWEMTTDHVECIEFLLRNPHSSRASPYSLPVAIETSSTHVCDLLLRADPGAVNSSYPEGETAIHCAIRIASLKKVQLLVDFRADLSIKWRGMTPLEFAICISSNTNIIELLAKACAIEESAKIQYLETLAFRKESTFMHARRLGLLHWISNNAEQENTQTFPSKANPIYHFISENKIKLNKNTGTETNPVVDQNNLINAIAHCYWCNLHPEKFHIMKAVIRVFKYISNKISKRKNEANLAFDTVLSGSVAEGTKTYQPDEFDLLCVFRIERSRSYKCYRGSKRADPRLLAQEFYSVLEEELFNAYQEGVDFGSISLHPHSLILSDKISRVQLLWNGVTFKNMVLSVDLVPAYRDYRVHNELELFDVECYKFHKIAKRSRHQFRYESQFHRSQSVAENRCIKYLIPDIRNGLAIAKALRIALICQPDNTDAFSLSEDISIEDVITSHMLKTCLLCTIETLIIMESNFRDDGIDTNAFDRPPRMSRNPLDRSFEWEQLYMDAFDRAELMKMNAFDWAERIYTELESRMNSGHYAGFWDDTRIFPEIVLRDCELKSELILFLCKRIKQWLADNKAELVAASYSKHLVYPRQWYLISEFLNDI